MIQDQRVSSQLAKHPDKLPYHIMRCLPPEDKDKARYIMERLGVLRGMAEDPSLFDEDTFLDAEDEIGDVIDTFEGFRADSVSRHIGATIQDPYFTCDRNNRMMDVFYSKDSCAYHLVRLGTPFSTLHRAGDQLEIYDVRINETNRLRLDEHHASIPFPESAKDALQLLRKYSSDNQMLPRTHNPFSEQQTLPVLERVLEPQLQHFVH